METRFWESKEDWGGPREMLDYINNLMGDYTILNVIPVEYYGSNYARITKAVIIIKKN